MVSVSWILLIKFKVAKILTMSYSCLIFAEIKQISNVYLYIYALFSSREPLTAILVHLY